MSLIKFSLVYYRNFVGTYKETIMDLQLQRIERTKVCIYLERLEKLQALYHSGDPEKCWIHSVYEQYIVCNVRLILHTAMYTRINMTHMNDTIYSVYVMLVGLSILHLCISHGILYFITNYQSRRPEQFRSYNKFHDINRLKSSLIYSL